MANKPQVWLIGGTSESAELAAVLSAQSIPYIVTVTTPVARALYPPMAAVRVGQLTPEDIPKFVAQQGIRCIVDASHPFACEISRRAMMFCQQGVAAYLRYERSDLAAGTTERSVTCVDSIETLVASDLLHHQRVLFTLGYRHLSLFSPLRQTSQLFARVLPSVEAISGALSAGFSPQEIIALRPPITPALEKALWQQWNLSRVVAKASGKPGGEAVKRQVAAELGVGLILIQRPPIRYLRQTASIREVVRFCTETLKVY
ncbi:MAG: cobalt-precorrin-6A reductase [Phormidesmis sp.]